MNCFIMVEFSVCSLEFVDSMCWAACVFHHIHMKDKTVCFKKKGVINTYQGLPLFLV